MTQAKQTISVRSHVGSDGILHLEVPVEMRNMDLDVTMTLQPVPIGSEVQSSESLGWPPGFFERTAGSIPDLERPPQGEHEVREAL